MSNQAAPAGPILALRQIVKSYGGSAPAVGPVDLTVERGEFLTLLGPSGCGKTTTLHIIAGLLSPSSGSVMLAGRDVTGIEPPKRDMGLVFQNYALFPHKTIFDNVAFGLRMRKVPKPEIRQRVMEMLDIVGLPNVENRMPDQLSGGQRQRVALARALVIRPTILLLDEPLSNLDAVLRKRMRYEIRELQQRLGITTIFVTHDQDEAFEMSDRVALLEKGHIAQLGAPEDLYDRPVSRFVAEFIGDANLLPGTVTGAGNGMVQIDLGGDGKFSAIDTSSALKSGDAAYFMIRPERVALLHANEAGALPARLVKRVFSGELLNLEFQTKGGAKINCSKPSLPQYRDLVPGQDVWLRLDDGRALKAS